MQQRESGKCGSFRELAIVTDFLHSCEYMKTSNCTNVEGDSEKWDPWKILKGWRVAICMEKKKDIVQRQQIKQKNCIKKPGSTGFSKTDSSDKPHMCGNKKHIFNLHIVLGNLFFFICWETSRNCVGYRGTVTRTSKRWSTPSSPGSEFLYVLQGNSASTSTCFSS